MNTNEVITIQFDGGCSPNPGAKYGSYSIFLHGSEAFSVSRLPFGHGTNNEAEFESCHEGIQKALELLSLAGLEPSAFVCKLVTDSTIVRNRLNGQRKNKQGSPNAVERRMATLANKCLQPLARFRSFRIEWQPRENNVALFGH